MMCCTLMTAFSPTMTDVATRTLQKGIQSVDLDAEDPGESGSNGAWITCCTFNAFSPAPVTHAIEVNKDVTLEGTWWRRRRHEASHAAFDALC